jgi:hypothetical protein
MLVILHLNFVENTRQCTGIVCAFRLVEVQNNGASIYQPPADEDQAPKLYSMASGVC